MTQVTKAQRIALRAARDYGTPYGYANPSNPRGWSSKPWRVSFADMLKRMKADGLFEGPYGEYNITQAGLDAI